MGAYLDQTELYLFNKGENCYSYRSLGCHRVILDGYETFRFAVWAPNAQRVSVVGSFNGWNEYADVMQPCGTTGVWETHIGIANIGDMYKYAILTADGRLIYKADPFAFYSQKRPNTASIVWDIGGYEWNDTRYMKMRQGRDMHAEPMSVYEVHLGSFQAGLNFDELSVQLVRYAADMGYTHIEIMPVNEYPLDDSWGYQITGYYSVTSRYGTPQQFMHFVDECHRAGLGVILDWVPAHFPRDEHGLRCFDGTPIFEHPDPRRSEQPQWGTLLFDYSRSEVRSFLTSNAVFFLKEFHIDALRVDAVSCMLYLDYGKSSGQWVPNIYGGRENLDAIAFLQQLSHVVKREERDALLIAEESTAFPYVTRTPEDGGLGFDFKWNMGWMNDTLSYMDLDSAYRRYHHDLLTFPMVYAFNESHLLPLSHDEVVHGKRSLIGRMPGNYDEKFRQLRLLYMYQFAIPGKKLLFMGGEFGQFIEWNFRKSLDWFLLDYDSHSDMQLFTRELNRFYRRTPELFSLDESWEGFMWLSVNDALHSIIAFLRMDGRGGELMCAFNFTPVKHEHYRVYLPEGSTLTQVMSNVDLREIKNLKTVRDQDGNHFIDIMLSPYEAVFYRVTHEHGGRIS